MRSSTYQIYKEMKISNLRNYSILVLKKDVEKVLVSQIDHNHISLRTLPIMQRGHYRSHRIGRNKEVLANILNIIELTKGLIFIE